MAATEGSNAGVAKGDGRRVRRGVAWRGKVGREVGGRWCGGDGWRTVMAMLCSGVHVQ